MNPNRYFTDVAMQNEWMDFQMSPFHQPMDWTQYHATLPPAYYAGKVAPAGGYADYIPEGTEYVGPARHTYSLVGPMYAAALMLFFLWSRR